MNAAQLHSLAKAVDADLKKTNIVQQLQKLRDHLQNQVNSPQDANHQKAVSQFRESIRTSLEESASNEFPPLWRHLLGELGIDHLLGNALSAGLEEVFQRNQITPSVALEEVRTLHQREETLQAHVKALLGAFDWLEIPTEEISPGEAAVGILIPRDAVDNELKRFGQELVTLNHVLGVFEELCTGSREPLHIRSIASTDLSILLDIDPAVGACMAVAIERIVALYKQLLEIKKLRRELAAQGVPETNLKAIDKHANAHMAEGIEPIVKDLMERYAVERDKGRRNELTMELRNGLNTIANRIDAGYNLEVRAGATPDTESEEADQKAAEAVATIRQATSAMHFLRPAGQPILALPEAADPEGKGKKKSGDGNPGEGDAQQSG